MELRDIEIFLVLAEELHSGRTAQRLHVSQAPLSVAADHQLAGRESVPLELLAELPHGTALDLQDYWEDSYLPFRTPRGRPIERIPSGRGQSVRSVRHWARAVERSCGRSEDVSSYCWSLTRSW
ncbi:hypothetical protein Sxan_03930 [Streptomyces xanthophaeus]|uniref:HTH lysR-type domain-containing protein n=1 Tax=Streptomyces xanthophaeus TaxID=67385 RepID=A0A919LG52_9ACTN|nr:hypothetical protein Sxan_03930 [Streptomyces xanthophaeus]